MSKSAWWSAVLAGAIAMPFEPDGSFVSSLTSAGAGRVDPSP